MTRRELILKGIKNLSVFLAGGICWSAIKSSANAQTQIFLRPPSALSESEFLKNCIKCGKCVIACPYNTLKLAEFSSNAKFHTPIFTPREIPCYLCEDFPCVVACPTDALNLKRLENDQKKPDIKKAKMGLSVIDQNSCIAYWGIQCDVCYRACPLIDKALKQVFAPNNRTMKHAYLLPSVDANFCTGCGKCERACVTKRPAIKVFPIDMLGTPDDNYVKGWERGSDKKLQNSSTKVNLNKEKAIDYLNSEDL